MAANRGYLDKTEVAMGARRPRGVSSRLRFEPDEAFEFGLWLRANDPKRWAAISDRAKVAVGYYELARACWMAGDAAEPAGDERGVHA